MLWLAWLNSFLFGPSESPFGMTTWYNNKWRIRLDGKRYDSIRESATCVYAAKER
jgi:hypothetical protein